MNERSPLITSFLERNSKLNLSAIRDAQGVYDKHIVDALELCQFDIIKPDMKVADVGTGGGWPLLALAHSYPNTHFEGIDARRKKMEAVQAIAIEAGLNNVQTQWSRIEDIRQHYNVVTARAVAYADILLDRIKPLVATQGYMILYKLDTNEENAIIRSWCRKHHCLIQYEHHYQLPGDEQKRILWIIKRQEKE